nr:immunoglobulin heavy chain junction region [Mus musculus]
STTSKMRTRLHISVQDPL